MKFYFYTDARRQPLFLYQILIPLTARKSMEQLKQKMEHSFPWMNRFIRNDKPPEVICSPLSYSQDVEHWNFTNEPRHNKTNKVTVRPVKTQINLGIHPVWSESSLCAYWVAKDPTFFMRAAKTLIRLGGCPGWSESSLGAQPYCWFCHLAAQILPILRDN